MSLFHKLNSICKQGFQQVNISWILVVGLLLRLVLSSFGTLELDMNTFIAWSRDLSENGFARFYTGWSDYLPGYLYILWILGLIDKFFLPTSVVLYKLPAILADLVTGYLIFQVMKPKNRRIAAMAAIFYIFNPAVMANSTLWGQVDSLTALFSLLSIFLLARSPTLSAISLSYGTLVKPQVAFAAPVVGFMMLKEKLSIKQILTYILVGLVIFIGGFVPFAGGSSNLVAFIIKRLGLSLGQYPFTSINAFNFWGLVGFWKSDTLGFLSARIWGFLFYLLAMAVSSVYAWKKKKSVYWLLAISMIASFMFLTRVHERHLLAGFAPLTIVSAADPVFWVIYFGFSLTYILNMQYSFFWINNNFQSIFSSLFINLLILFNLFFFCFSFFADRINTRRLMSRKPRIGKNFVLLILTFSLVTRLVALDYPKGEYFDEVYHAFTAQLMLQGDAKAWEWWNPHPPGYAYEWTHPPMAKEIMVLGMLIFGRSPFGWRAPAAIFGTGVVFLIYLISKEIFKREDVAILASAFSSLDGLLLVMSRIGMNDIYFLFFVLLSLYLFLKDRIFFSALTLGLAGASKWSTFWFIPVLFLAHFVFKKRLRRSYLWFFVLPASVYLLSYLPFFTSGHSFSQFFNLEALVKCLGKYSCSYPFGLQQQMWWYHTRLVAEHSYSSAWWTWPLMLRPIYLFTDKLVVDNYIGESVSRIYAMGNPLIFWFGLASVVLSIYYSLTKKDRKLGFLLFCYLVFFIPWAASPRIMFLYHYLPSLPFMTMMAGFILKKNFWLAGPIFAVAIFLFFYFYPHWTGLSIPIWLDSSYYWFTSWR